MSNFNRKSGLPPGRVHIQLMSKGGRGRPIYYLGEWGASELWVNLAEVKFLVFQSKENPGDLTLMIGDKQLREEEGNR